jgi:hypothetical protein
MDVRARYALFCESGALMLASKSHVHGRAAPLVQVVRVKWRRPHRKQLARAETIIGVRRVNKRLGRALRTQDSVIEAVDPADGAGIGRLRTLVQAAGCLAGLDDRSIHRIVGAVFHHSLFSLGEAPGATCGLGGPLCAFTPTDTIDRPYRAPPLPSNPLRQIVPPAHA